MSLLLILINILLLSFLFVSSTLLVDLGADNMSYMLNFVDFWIIFYILLLLISLLFLWAGLELV